MYGDVSTRIVAIQSRTISADGRTVRSARHSQDITRATALYGNAAALRHIDACGIIG